MSKRTGNFQSSTVGADPCVRLITFTLCHRGCVKTKIAYHFVILSMAKNLNTSIMCLQITPR